MKNMLKLLSIVLCLAMLFSFAGCKDTENDSEEKKSHDTTVTVNPLGGNSGGGDTVGGSTRLSQDGVDYLITDGKLIISGNGVVTREAIESLSPAFNYVDFESGSFDIGDNAFNGYSNLIEVQFRNNVRNIGAGAFQGTSLAIVVFGESVEGIGDKAFADTLIDYVLINNRAMFENFNSRYDFGEVALTANNIYVHTDFVPFESGKDYTTYKSIAGAYLADSGFFEKLNGVTSGHHSLAMESYQFRNICGESEFLPIRADIFIERVMDDSFSYNSDNNYFTYCFSYNMDPWEKLNIVRYDGTEDGSKLDTSGIGTKGDSADTDYKRVSGNDGGNNGGGSNNGGSGGFKDNGGGIKDNGSDCFICGGSGKKACTSCDGGYIIEYESGQYLGNGSITREVRKDCPVCVGGQVTCYH